MENTIIRNQLLGQSTWLDFIQRSTLTTGQLGELVRKGVTGLTSNPTIFEKAVTTSTDYDVALREFANDSRPAAEIFETLSIEDIQGAADVLRSIYDFTEGRDGYASLEVRPSLAHDARGTVAEARRLVSLLKRPNVMIKVPGTTAGMSAIRTLIGDGINVNVTLIFSVDVYRKVIDAYISGLEDLISSGKDPSSVASVASFFVSRIDTAVDAQLRESGGPAELLTGKTAIANARLAYEVFQQEFANPRFEELRAKGAQVQRPLWASTSTKDPSLSDTLYVDSLVGKDTVDTVPPATLDALLDHGKSEDRLSGTADAARVHMRAIADAGVDLAEVTDRLLVEGLAAFSKSYDQLLIAIDSKRRDLARAAP